MSKNTVVGLHPIGERVLVFIYDDGESSIDIGDGKRLITSIRDTEFESVHNTMDNKHPGIRGRWAAVVGTNDSTPTEFDVGTKVFCDEMKWSRGFMAGSTGERVWNIPWKDILLIDKDGFSELETIRFGEYLKGFVD